MNVWARKDADARWNRIWTLGGIALDRQRVARIAAWQDWMTVLSPRLCRYPMPERRSA